MLRRSSPRRLTMAATRYLHDRQYYYNRIDRDLLCRMRVRSKGAPQNSLRCVNQHIILSAHSK